MSFSSNQTNDLVDSIPCQNKSMIFFEQRLKTFDTWNKQLRPDKFSLAKAGLYYSGTADIVYCFSCGLKLYSWETNDDPLVEHDKFSTECPYLKVIGTQRDIVGRSNFTLGAFGLPHNYRQNFGGNSTTYGGVNQIG
jgi:hypothetical protein